MKKQNRDEVLRISVTEAEKKELTAFASSRRMTLSEFIRQAAFREMASSEQVA